MKNVEMNHLSKDEQNFLKSMMGQFERTIQRNQELRFQGLEACRRDEAERKQGVGK